MLQGLKVVFVFGSLELGGAERQGLILARALKENYKASVEIWGLASESGRLSHLCEEHGIFWRGVPFSWPGQWYLFPLRFRELFKFARSLRQARPDIVLPYVYSPDVLCGLTWKFSGARLCIWNQRDEGLLSNGNLLERIAVGLTPRFISNSVAGKNFLLNTYPIDSERISVIPNGLDLQQPVHDRTTWRKTIEVDEQRFLACMVGNVHRYKDHRTLLKAWEYVIDRTKNDGPAPVLLLAGRFDEGEAELRGLVSKLNPGGNIRLLGKVDDISGLLGAVDLYIHSSKSEGCPNAVLEAMGSRLPVVATDIPGIRDAVGTDAFQFLTPPGNPEAMADRILEFYNDKTIRKTVGLKLKKRAEQEFDPEVMCQRTVSVILKYMDAQ